MTRQDFIQQAALRLISANPDISMVEVAYNAEQLATILFGEEEPLQEPQKEEWKEKPQTDAPIGVLVSEIDRLDKQCKYEHSAYSKRGHGSRLQTVCNKHDITTVGQLLEKGRENFKTLYLVGKGLMVYLDQALNNLYGITEW